MITKESGAVHTHTHTHRHRINIRARSPHDSENKLVYGDTENHDTVSPTKGGDTDLYTNYNVF